MATMVAHLADLHLEVGAAGRERTDRFRRVLGQLLLLRPQPVCVVICGDLVEHGSGAEYRLLEQILRGYPLPLHLAVGNHDDPAELNARFSATPFIGNSSAGRVSYQVEYPDVTVIVLDSRVAGSGGGRIGRDQLRWLEGALACGSDKPTLVALHHVPAATGIPFLDTMTLADADELADVVRRSGRVVRILAGHIHRALMVDFAGTIAAVAPGLGLQTRLATEGGPPQYVDEPTGYLLHLEAGRSWVTHVVPIAESGPPPVNDADRPHRA